jgi:hypothetical protein
MFSSLFKSIFAEIVLHELNLILKIIAKKVFLIFKTNCECVLYTVHSNVKGSDCLFCFTIKSLIAGSGAELRIFLFTIHCIAV